MPPKGSAWGLGCVPFVSDSGFGHSGVSLMRVDVFREQTSSDHILLFSKNVGRVKFSNFCPSLPNHIHWHCSLCIPVKFENGSKTPTQELCSRDGLPSPAVIPVPRQTSLINRCTFATTVRQDFKPFHHNASSGPNQLIRVDS